MLPTKLHVNGWELTSELTSKWITFNNTQSNFTPISLITFALIIKLRQIYREVAVIRANVACKTTRETVENWRPNWRLKWITFNNTQSNFTPISLITFAVNNQTLPNLQGSCRDKSQCCLQKYMRNGWELTSELTSKWITFNNTQSNFTPI